MLMAAIAGLGVMRLFISFLELSLVNFPLRKRNVMHCKREMDILYKSKKEIRKKEAPPWLVLYRL